MRRVKIFLPYFLTQLTQKMALSPLCTKGIFNPNCLSILTPLSHYLCSSNPHFTACQDRKGTKGRLTFFSCRTLLPPCSHPTRRHSQKSSAKSMPNKWEIGLGTKAWFGLNATGTASEYFQNLKYYVSEMWKCVILSTGLLHTAGIHGLKQPSKQSQTTG